MASIDYSILVPDVLAALRADPSDPVTESAIKRTVIEFCAATLVWKHNPAAMNVVASTATYAIVAPADASVVAVISAQLDGEPLSPKGIDWLDSNVKRWRTDPGRVAHFTQTDPSEVVLAPPPSASMSAALTMTVALQPTRAATGFPQWIYDHHGYVLTDGALAKLMLMSDKPWSDPQLGADARARFETAVASIRASADTSLGRAAARVTAQH